MRTTYPKVTQFPKNCFSKNVFENLKTVDNLLRELRKENPYVGYDGVMMADYCWVKGNIISKELFIQLLVNDVRHLRKLPKGSVVPYIDIEVTYVPDKLYVSFITGHSHLNLGCSAFYDLGKRTTCIYLPDDKKNLVRFLKRLKRASNSLRRY